MFSAYNTQFTDIMFKKGSVKKNISFTCRTKYVVKCFPFVYNLHTVINMGALPFELKKFFDDILIFRDAHVSTGF